MVDALIFVDAFNFCWCIGNFYLEMEFHLYLQAIEILRNMQGTIKLKVRKNSSEKKLSFSTTNHLDPEPGTKSVFQLQSAPGIQFSYKFKFIFFEMLLNH